MRPLFLAFLRISSFIVKLMRQPLTSLGGSASLPLGRSARCRRSISIGVSGGLASKSLKMATVVCESWPGS